MAGGAVTPEFVKSVLDKLRSIGQETGIFAGVDGHEPKSAPVLGQGGIHLALFSGIVTPSGEQSGLNSASIRWQIEGRVYRNAMSEPADDIDPETLGAASTYLTALMGQFTLGGLIRCVDIYGMAGDPLKATPGYIEQDKVVYRAIELEIPLLLNDVYNLAP